MISPKIVFKDENFVVLSKPAGFIVNNSDTSRNEYTLQDFVIENFQISGGLESEFVKRGGIVHRLDKETSGVIVVALNEKSFIFIQNQFKERKVKKEYVALCHGKMAEEGQINVPIGRLPWNRKRFGVIPKGRESFTEFQIIRRFELVSGKKKEALSLIRVLPRTGRTHQIRVHCQYIGHPIFADALYAGRKTYNHDKRYLDRHFLHASKIAFVSPTTRKVSSFESDLPDDLENFLSTLK